MSAPLPTSAMPDAPGATRVTCTGTDRRPGCGFAFGDTAANPRGEPVGRSHCPKCGRLRQIPADRHDEYAKWFPAVEYTAERLVALGIDPVEAEAAASDAYTVGVLRWVPGRRPLGAFITKHMREVVRFRGMRAADRPQMRQLDVPETADPSPSAAAESAAAADDRAAAAAKVAGLLGALPPRLAEVLRLCHGIGCEPHTLAEAGRALGVSRERVRQLAAKATARLRDLAGVTP